MQPGLHLHGHQLLKQQFARVRDPHLTDVLS